MPFETVGAVCRVDAELVLALIAASELVIREADKRRRLRRSVRGARSSSILPGVRVFRSFSLRDLK